MPSVFRDRKRSLLSATNSAGCKQPFVKLAISEYKTHNNLSPPYLKKISTTITNVHSYNLRNSESNCYIARPKTEFGKGRLHYRGSVLWNRIPSEMRNLSSLREFKIFFHGKE